MHEPRARDVSRSRSISRHGGDVRALEIAVVIPCYRVRDRVVDVIRTVGPEVSRIIVVDDECPENSGEHVRRHCDDKRVVVLRNDTNLGVGGATKVGYRHALEGGADIVVKLDGDGQMRPALIPELVRPIVEGRADYVKGNRFFNLADLTEMPWPRLLGNAGLSLVTKFSTGYWDIMDPTNGFTAIHARVLGEIPLSKVADDYFFESDLLFRLATLRAVVADMPMVARYSGGPSSLSIPRVLLRFPARHARNLVKRLFYCYFLRDFNAGTFLILAGMSLAAGGGAFGGYQWWKSIASGVPASSGTVMAAALPVMLGGHLLLSAINFDIANVPRRCIHFVLGPRTAR